MNVVSLSQREAASRRYLDKIPLILQKQYGPHDADDDREQLLEGSLVGKRGKKLLVQQGQPS